jgi:hypothetical protein
MTRGHAAIDRAARDRTANRPGRRAEKPVTDEAMAHYSTGHSAYDRSGSR